MTRIQSLWNTPRVLDVIEESLFRKPGRPSEAFGLEAYRELLMLYAIANEFVDLPLQPNFDQTDMPGSENPALSSALEQETTVVPPTELQPLSASAVHGVDAEELPVAIEGDFSAGQTAGMNLDVDLTDSWVGVDSLDTDDTIILKSRNPGTFQPPSSAWLDFDLSDIKPAVVDAGDAEEVIKGR